MFKEKKRCALHSLAVLETLKASQGLNNDVCFKEKYIPFFLDEKLILNMNP